MEPIAHLGLQRFSNAVTSTSVAKGKWAKIKSIRHGDNDDNLGAKPLGLSGFNYSVEEDSRRRLGTQSICYPRHRENARPLATQDYFPAHEREFAQPFNSNIWKFLVSFGSEFTSIFKGLDKLACRYKKRETFESVENIHIHTPIAERENSFKSPSNL